MSSEKYKPFEERPNVKIGVTNKVHSRLRELKKSGDSFNDVIDRLLVQSSESTKLKPKI